MKRVFINVETDNLTNVKKFSIRFIQINNGMYVGYKLFNKKETAKKYLSKLAKSHFELHEIDKALAEIEKGYLSINNMSLKIQEMTNNVAEQIKAYQLILKTYDLEEDYLKHMGS